MMKQIRILLAALLLIQMAARVQAQGSISGSITDSSGNPVPYATVYIQELQHGTTANAAGNYELKLPDGVYTVFFQSLGYNQDFRQVSIAGNAVIRNVALTMQYFQIPEVSISASKEDPAYVIMRKAISRAPYFLNAVEHYKAEVYLKGTVTVNNIPRLFRKTLSANEVPIKEGDKYLMESHNEIEFDAPDKYIHRLIAIQSTFPSEGESVSPMDYVQASFYEPVIADMAISPLSPNAFSHYRFTYQGASLQGQFVINKIKVTPKRKSQQTFTGTIYIIEDLWCIHSLDLENENLVGKIRVQQVYTPVKDDFWMPVSHKFDIALSMIGIKADVGYGSSVRYSEIRTSQAIAVLPAMPGISQKEVPERPPTEKTKNYIEIDELLSKDEMTTREMVRLSKLLEKESASAGQERDPKKDLEIVQKTKYIIEEDATAKSPDFWKDIRPIPLSDDEMKSVKATDSLKTELKEVKTTNVVSVGISAGKSTPFSRTVREIATGKTWRMDSNRVSLNFGGLAKPENFSFNSVDGLTYDIDFRFSKRNRRGTGFSLYPEFGYAFGRKDAYWTLNTTLNYSKMSDAHFWLRASDKTVDFGNYGSVNSFINTLSSLLFKENYVRLYRSRKMSIGHRSEIKNGIYLELSAGAERRGTLENSTEFSLFNRDRLYKPNVPDNKLIDRVLYPAFYPVGHTHYNLTTELTIIPWQRYRMAGARRIPAGSEFPTINLRYSHIFNDINGILKNFGSASAMVYDSNETGPMAEFSWRLRTGINIGGDSIPFQDYFHFNSQPAPLILNDYRDAFYLPGFYTLASDKWFLEGHLKYTNPYLLVKYLPWISNTLMRENIYASYLLTNMTRHYFEAGYSISEIFLLGEVGIFAGFEEFRFRNAGVKFILKFN
jgi:hypothetical protein